MGYGAFICPRACSHYVTPLGYLPPNLQRLCLDPAGGPSDPYVPRLSSSPGSSGLGIEETAARYARSWCQTLNRYNISGTVSINR